MNNAILIAVISGALSIIAASLSFYFTKRHELKMKWRDEKLNHYKVLFSALSDIAVDGMDKEEANRKFSLATNTIALSASQEVISALMSFQDYVKFSNKSQTIEEHDRLLKELLIAVRKDIGLNKRDDPKTFLFHLIGSKPK